MKGDMSIKERQTIKNNWSIRSKIGIIQKVLNKFSDASLVDVISDKKDC